MLKRIFIKLCRMMGYEIIDQNQFESPTINKSLDDNLSILNKKSIVLPLGEVKITKKVSSLLIIFRCNTKIKIWDQNKERIFNKDKAEYTLRCLNSLIKTISNAKNKFQNIDFKLTIVDDNSKKEILNQINTLVNKVNISTKIINLNNNENKEFIKVDNQSETFGNLNSLLKCFNLAKEEGRDLIFFVEDDYLHTENMIEEMVLTYERISSQLNKEIILCPADYPFQYMTSKKTNILIGSHRHWQIINKTLCTFLISKSNFNKYWENFLSTCKKRNDPFEKYLNEIYEREYCLSPIGSLSIHLTNINSSYGIPPHVNIKKIWDSNLL